MTTAQLRLQESTESPGVSVVVPTRNEAGNITELIRRIRAVAGQADVREVVVVDDSDDDTPLVVLESATGPGVPVRLLHREPGRRNGGLSGAVVAGMRVADKPWVVVMDADLQHPPEDLVRLADARRDGDLVIASRYCAGGSAAGLSDWRRRLVSRLATWLAILCFPGRLAGLTDTMTGYFAVNLRRIDLERLRPDGFKILLEILGRCRMHTVEIPFEFARRHQGSSKARLNQGLRFLAQLARLRIRAWIEWVLGRASAFASVGVICLVIDVALFNLLLPLGKPLTARVTAGVVAVIVSYWLNRTWTWRERPSRPWQIQLIGFAAVSGIGVGISTLCLAAAHLLGFDSVLASNIATNVVGLGLSMIWRYWAYDRLVFSSRR